MERILQHNWVKASVLLAVVTAACGPIEPEPLDPGGPYIDPDKVNPDRQTVQVRSNTSIEVSTLYDPNEHDNLFIVWMSDKRGFLGSFERDRTGTTGFQRNDFYTYEGAAIDLNPCALGEQQQEETLWLYVADRRFTETTDQSVEVDEDGFLTSRAWNIEYFPVNCD